MSVAFGAAASEPMTPAQALAEFQTAGKNLAEVMLQMEQQIEMQQANAEITKKQLSELRNQLDNPTVGYLADQSAGKMADVLKTGYIQTVRGVEVGLDWITEKIRKTSDK